MLPCEQVLSQLPQYVADGEPHGPEYHGLRTHLGACLRCRAYLEQLRQVEQALRTLPRQVPDPRLRARILRAVVDEALIDSQWHLFPWTVWVPTLALVLALVVTFYSIPATGLIQGPRPELGAIVQQLDTPAPWGALAQIDMAADRFWTLWIGLFVSTAGVGLMLSLSRWNASHSRTLAQLERQVQHVAQRLTRRVRQV